MRPTGPVELRQGYSLSATSSNTQVDMIEAPAVEASRATGNQMKDQNVEIKVSVDNTVHSANISESDTVPGDGATKAVVVNVLDGTLNGAKDEMPEQVSATDACAGLKFWPRAPRGNPTGKPSQPADSPKPRKSVTVKARAERSDPRHSSRPAAPHTPAQGRSAKKQGGGGCVIA